jgi:hypothetical protein
MCVATDLKFERIVKRLAQEIDTRDTHLKFERIVKRVPQEIDTRDTHLKFERIVKRLPHLCPQQLSLHAASSSSSSTTTITFIQTNAKTLCVCV